MENDKIKRKVFYDETAFSEFISSENDIKIISINRFKEKRDTGLPTVKGGSFKYEADAIELWYSEPEKEYRSKKEEVLNRFRKEFIEGNYLSDPKLHAIVELLIRDADPYQIIEELILQDQQLSDQYKKLHESGVRLPQPFFISQ